MSIRAARLNPLPPPEPEVAITVTLTFPESLLRSWEVNSRLGRGVAEAFFRTLGSDPAFDPYDAVKPLGIGA